MNTKKARNEFVVTEDLLLKFPINLIHHNGQLHPEISDEEILKGNEYYKIVSRQIVNDTLYVRCEFSQTARERFWSLVSTFDDHSKTSKNSNRGVPHAILKNLLKEYMAMGRKHTFYFFEWSETASYHYLTCSLLNPSVSISSPPPDSVLI